MTQVPVDDLANHRSRARSAARIALEMSGIEVVAAVSAVVSAFHAGSELLKHIKQRRRKARAKQQEFEEKQLQDSLVSGEQQIGFRYAQDMRELGDIVRVGDVIARDRLLHIALTLQAEIIKSLQMAAKYETAVLNLQILHETSIVNRKDTFVTLDELKQRIITTRSIPRQIEEGLGQRFSVATVPSSRTNTFDSAKAVPDDYIPPAVILNPQDEAKETRSGLTRYFSKKRNSSVSAKPTSSSVGTPTEKPNINYSAAFQQLVKARGQDHATVLKDIDDIMVSYKDLDLGIEGLDEPWGQNQHANTFARRDTWAMLNSGLSPKQDPFVPSWDPMHPASPAPPLAHPYPGQAKHEHPVFNHGMFNGHQQHQPHTASSPYPRTQTQQSHRWSNPSVSSSPRSDTSWNRNDSNSSQSSYTQSDPRYSIPSPQLNKIASSPSNFPHAATSDQYSTYLSPRPTSYAPSEESYTAPIAPLAFQPRATQSNIPIRTIQQHGGPANAPNVSHEMSSSPIQDPYSSDQQRVMRATSAPLASPSTSPEPGSGSNGPLRPDLLTAVTRETPSSHSSLSERTVTPVFGAPSAVQCKTVSASGIRQPSIASTDSSESGSGGVIPRPPGGIGSSTIRSPQPGQDRLMGGRPCRDNNYWGFCKGAWDIREDAKKGLALRTMPSGMYNTKEIWECKQCNFRGNTYIVTHPGKKSKKETVVDPNIHTSKSGIRYRWIFLAKSHVRKKTPDSAHEDCNYGCVLCSVEGNVTSIFGNVETLMYHLLEHVSDMTQKSMKQSRCIVGRTAGPEEDWDINMPLFADVEEA